MIRKLDTLLIRVALVAVVAAVSDYLEIAEQRDLIRRVRLPGRGGPQGFVIAAEEVGP